MEKYAVCFFGHRDVNIKIRPALYAEIERHITQHKITTFYVGNHGNFDCMSVGILNELKRKYAHIEIVLVCAYLTTKKKTKYEMNLYDSTLYPEGLEDVPQRFAITYRNRWMVEQSDCLIAYVRTSYGGAYTALQYAKRKNKRVTNLADIIIYESL